KLVCTKYSAKYIRRSIVPLEQSTIGWGLFFGFANLAVAAAQRFGQPVVAAGRQDFLLDLLSQLRAFFEEQPRLFLPLPKLQVAVAEPGARAANNLLLHAHVQQVAFVADPIGVQHVELGRAERRRDLVLDDLRPDALADHFFAFLELP